jgi:hypothetical protein
MPRCSQTKALPTTEKFSGSQINCTIKHVKKRLHTYIYWRNLQWRNLLFRAPYINDSGKALSGKIVPHQYSAHILVPAERRPVGGKVNMCKADYLTAASPNITATELVLLSQNDSSAIRARVAENPNCPLYLLAYLVQDSHWDVRLGVACNPRVTMNLLEWLLQDPCPDVRFALAEDHNLPEELLAVLCQDDNPYVAQRAHTTMMRVKNLRVIGSIHSLPMDSALDLKAG